MPGDEEWTISIVKRARNEMEAVTIRKASRQKPFPKVVSIVGECAHVLRADIEKKALVAR